MAEETRYAQNGDLCIAYRVIDSGDGLDVVLVPGAFTHLEHMQLRPRAVRSERRLASFARLITFDKRGTGLSDRAAAMPTLAQRPGARKSWRRTSRRSAGTGAQAPPSRDAPRHSPGTTRFASGGPPLSGRR